MAEGILGEIIAAKRVELAQRLSGVSLDDMRAAARPTRRSLTAAIAKPGGRFILEVKKASPSQGVIRRDVDVAALAQVYAPVADALSVLTDSAFFGGSLDDLRTACSNFAGPVLAKDFFIDPRQVVEARLAGADAILVMLSVLGDADARSIIGEARQLGMDALVEVHDEAEMRRALALGAPLIGINNRDLRDLTIDLATTERLAPLAPGRHLVSESGIASPSDVGRLCGLVDGFLVGSALMRAEHQGEVARELVHGRVKLCGLNRAEDIDSGGAATFAGFVFVAQSPRFIELEAAARLAAQARAKGMKTAGVFRNASPASVVDAQAELKLDAVQLHGSEDEPYVEALRRHLPEATEIWTALSVGRDPLRARGGDRMLFDHGDGGSGQAFDWSLLPGRPDLGTAIVAGGIGVHNAARAAGLGAFAIDVGSGVDARPGVKSPWKIRALFEELRPAGREALAQCA